MKDFTPWPEEFAITYREKGYWLEKTIGEIMDENFKRYAEHTALIGEDNRIFSYAELEKLVNRLALHLHSLGLRLYDKVVLQIPNKPEVVISYLAIIKAGCIPVMALPAHRQTEIEHFVRFSDARALAIESQIKDFDFQEMACNIQKESNTLEFVLVTGAEPIKGYYSIDKLLEDPIEKRIDQEVLPRPNANFPVVFQLSGGTTGLPKLIPRTHNDYVHNFLQCAEICNFNEEIKVLIAIPQLHNFAIACPGLKSVLSKGGCEILTKDTRPKAILELIQRYKVTHWQAVPAMILNVLNYPHVSDYNLDSLKIIISGGAKLNPEVAIRIKETLKCEFQEVLGFAEGPLLFTRLNDPEEVKIHTQGRPISPGDEFKIVQPDRKEEVKPGEVGELWVRGPHTIRGYFRAPEQNAKDFTADGFYKTGDLVSLHQSGNVIYEGRVKDIINRGGENISAEEVENHVLAHHMVSECAVVAMPDPIMGEKTCVFVVPKQDQEIPLEDLNTFLYQERKIAKFKLPERLEIVESLPLTKVGKINKKHLRELITAQIEKEKMV